jgi:hypothetical protein
MTLPGLGAAVGVAGAVPLAFALTSWSFQCGQRGTTGGAQRRPVIPVRRSIRCRPDHACALGGLCLAAFLFILAAARASFSRISFTHSVVDIVRRE